MRPFELTLEGGEGGRAVGLEGEVLHLIWPTAKAPGQPLALRGQLGAQGLALSAKTIGSRRREDGHYDVRVRLVNLRRADRQRLQAALGSGE